jgi:hypothetical protein
MRSLDPSDTSESHARPPCRGENGKASSHPQLQERTCVQPGWPRPCEGPCRQWTFAQSASCVPLVDSNVLSPISLSYIHPKISQNSQNSEESTLKREQSREQSHPNANSHTHTRTVTPKREQSHPNANSHTETRIVTLSPPHHTHNKGLTPFNAPSKGKTLKSAQHGC